MRLQGFRGNPEVILLGDATGKATQRSSNKSDYDIVKETLKEAEIRFTDKTPESNPSIRDRVNSVNSKCKNAHGDANLWVHDIQCRHLVYDMERVTWKEGADFLLNPGPLKELTHNSDSIGYPIHALTPIRGVRAGKQRIIQRTF